MPRLQQPLHHLRTPERNDLRVIKRGGVREPFKREKLLDGILKACEKRPVGIEIVEQAVEHIVSELYAQNLREIPSRMIGPLVMRKLQDIDPVAYVRYASVYRQFEEVGEFINEIESLENLPQRDTGQEELSLDQKTASKPTPARHH